ncbi:MAG: hypothetical protein PHQ27_10870, partial [Victivallales bacterium]|nr:hypothetical protein [Victivallales bacterium]
MPDKMPGDEITQIDLKQLRQRLINLAISEGRYMVVDESKLPLLYNIGESAGEEPFSFPLRPVPNGEFGNQRVWKALGDKPFTKVPGQYTSTKHPVYSADDNFDGVPVLWEHFKEMEQIVNNFGLAVLDAGNLTAEKFTQTYLNPTGQPPYVETIFHNFVGISSTAEITMIYDEQDGWMVDFKSCSYCRGAKKFTGTWPDDVSAIDVYIKIEKHCNHQRLQDHKAYDIFTWRKVRIGSPNDEIEMGVTYGYIPADPPPAPEVGTYSNYHSYHEMIAHVLYDPEYEKISLTKPQSPDDWKDNAVVNTGCTICQSPENPTCILDQMLRKEFSHAKVPLALSTGWDCGLIFGHYLGEVQAAGLTSRHYNCETVITNHYTKTEPDGTCWRFSELLRPSGIYVVFAWNGGGNQLAKPIDNSDYCVMRQESGDNNYSVEFRRDSVWHFFVSGALEHCEKHQNGEILKGSLPGDGVSIRSGGGGTYNNKYYQQMLYECYAGIATTWEEMVIPGDPPVAAELVDFARDGLLLLRWLLDQFTGWEPAMAAATPAETMATTATTTNYAPELPATATSSEMAAALLGVFGITTEVKYGDQIQCNRLGQPNTQFQMLDLADGDRTVANWKMVGDTMTLDDCTRFHTWNNQDGENITEISGYRSGQAKTVTREIRKMFPWGQEIVRIEIAPETADVQLDTFSYGENREEYPDDYGREIAARHHDGSWRRRHYDGSGRLLREITPFGHQLFATDDADCRVVTYDYTLLDAAETTYPGDSRARTEIETVGGVEISRRYHVYEANTERDLVATVAGAAWNAATNLVTVRTSYVDGDWAGRLHTVTDPDGKRTEYAYQAVAGGGLITTVRSGYGPTGSPLQYGTATVTTTDADGMTTSRVVTDLASSLVIEQETYQHDAYGRVTRTDYADGSY